MGSTLWDKVGAVIQGGLQGIPMGVAMQQLPKKYARTLIRTFDIYNILQEGARENNKLFLSSELEQIVSEMQAFKEPLRTFMEVTRDETLARHLSDMEERIRTYQQEYDPQNTYDK